MKKLLMLVLAAVMLCSCTGRKINIIHQFGHIVNRDFHLFDTEIVTEVSTQIMMVKVLSLDSIEVQGKEYLSFRYTAEVEEIYLDTKDAFQVGSTLSFTNSNALIKARDAAALLESSDKALQYGILQGEYGPDDYIRSASSDVVPIEVGSTYILYFSDHRLDTSGFYTVLGTEMYLCSGSKVYTGYDRVLSESSADELIEQIRQDIEARTGRADEIGSDAYIAEVSEAHYREQEQTQ